MEIIMKYKLLVMDIDDTLVSNARPVSHENAAAIRRAREAGVYVTVATGRSYFGTRPVVKQLDLDTYVINYGGAVIMDAKTEKPLFVTELEDKYIKEILRMASELGVHAHIYQDDCVIYEKDHPYVQAYTKLLDLPHRVEPDIRKMHWENVPKALIITEPERVKELMPIFKAHFEGRVHVSESSAGFIEFNRVGANKGTAAESVAARLGIPHEQTAAIGDNTLDYELIKWASLGAVVGNGNEKLKAVADVITPPCCENGVAWLIDNYILTETER